MHSPPRIIPHRGQVSENDSESPRSESWGVFHVDVPRHHLANDAGELSPQPGALASESFATAGKADILARESTRYHVNKAAPWSSVKGAHIIPNRERREVSGVLPVK
jgi:hypothetical protein